MNSASDIQISAVHRINGDVLEENGIESKEFDYISILQGVNLIDDISHHFLSDMCFKKTDIYEEIIRYYGEKSKTTKNEKKPQNDMINDGQVNLFDGRSGSSNSNLTKKLKIKTFDCSHCDVKFASEQILKEHENNVHKLKTNIYKCDQCSCVYTTKEGLRRHSMNHRPDIQYRCQFCDKILSSEANLRAHITRHTGNKRFKCEKCTKTFTTKTGLQCHEAIHLEYKPYKCTKCDKVFNSKQSLRYHTSLHNRERDLYCGLCDNSFTSEQGLKVHMKKHRTNGVLNCKICKKSFMCNKLFQRHYFAHFRKNAAKIITDVDDDDKIDELANNEGVDQKIDDMLSCNIEEDSFILDNNDDVSPNSDDLEKDSDGEKTSDSG